MKLIFSAIVALNSLNAVASDTAERFGHYVDQVIPMTFALANGEAKVREGALFTERFSQVQSELLQASDAATDIAATTTELDRYKNSTDIESVARSLVHASNLINAANVIRARLEEYSKKRNALEFACRSTSAFNVYDVRHLDMNFVIPNIEALDNTYIELNPITATVTGLISIFQVITNTGEQSKIDEHAQRLTEHQVSTPEYQNFARAACQNYIDMAKPGLDKFDELSTSMMSLAQSVDTKKLNILIQSLLKTLDAIEASYRDDFIQEATREVLLRGTAASQRTALLRQSAELSRKINRNLVRLAETACGEGARLIVDIKEAIATSETKALRNSTQPGFFNSVRQELAVRASRCGGSYL